MTPNNFFKIMSDGLYPCKYAFILLFDELDNRTVSFLGFSDREKDKLRKKLDGMIEELRKRFKENEDVDDLWNQLTSDYSVLPREEIVYDESVREDIKNTSPIV